MRPPVHPPNAKVILIVDDDTDVREATADLLLDMGYLTVSAGSGAEALKLIERGCEPSVMLVDLEMPGMDGEELMMRCQELPQLAGVPRVFVSGTKEPEGLLQRTGARSFLSKPIDDRRLGNLLQELGLTAASYVAR